MTYRGRSPVARSDAFRNPVLIQLRTVSTDDPVAEHLFRLPEIASRISVAASGRYLYEHRNDDERIVNGSQRAAIAVDLIVEVDQPQPYEMRALCVRAARTWSATRCSPSQRSRTKASCGSTLEVCRPRRGDGPSGEFPSSCSRPIEARTWHSPFSATSRFTVQRLLPTGPGNVIRDAPGLLL
jgi:hypothetical protein